jgi:small basic protein
VIISLDAFIENIRYYAQMAQTTLYRVCVCVHAIMSASIIVVLGLHLSLSLWLFGIMMS